MSTHGRRGPRLSGTRQAPPRPGPASPAQFGWALLVIAAALVGGLAAAAIVHTTITTAVIASVITGGVAVLAVFRWPASPPEFPASRAPLPPQASRDPYASQDPRTVPMAQTSRSVSPASFPPPAPGPADGQEHGGPTAGGETMVQLLPLPAQPGQPAPDAPWWDSAQGSPPPSRGSNRAPAPDLSTYLASTFIAQCPRCGAFRLDIRRGRAGWAFRCEACEQTWTWQPGTPWPPVRVMPRDRRE